MTTVPGGLQRFLSPQIRALDAINRLSALLIALVVLGLGVFGWSSLRAARQSAHRVQESYQRYDTFRTLSSYLNDEYTQSLQYSIERDPLILHHAGWFAQGFENTLKRANSRADSPKEHAMLARIDREHRQYERLSQAYLAALSSKSSVAAARARRSRLEDQFLSMEHDLYPRYQADLARAQALQRSETGSETRLQNYMGGLAVLAALVLIVVLYSTRIYKRRSDKVLSEEIERLEHAALTDSLTGLGNHRAFYEEFEREVSRSRRNDLPLTLALLDLDDFKSVNDTRGHKHGDSLLIALAGVMSANRLQDAAYRLGGDEFAILLLETDAAAAQVVAERLREQIEILLAPVTVSMGISTMSEDHDQHDLYESADAALYAAKSRGRNAVVFFDRTNDESTVFSNRKASALRTLLESGEVDIAFQPIWNLSESSILGFEALARPMVAGELQGPQEAFDIAERIRRTAELDALCIANVFKHAESLPPGAILFVNVSPDSLSHPQLSLERWLDMIEAADLEPSRIVVELTERRIANPEQVLLTISALRICGIRIALDDTGSGYAGLNLLTQTAFDFVKVDRSIVAGAQHNRRTRAVLAGIIAIARESNSFVIAEGIETPEQLAFLRGLQADRGVQGAQGFLLGRPTLDKPDIDHLMQYAYMLAEPELNGVAAG